MDLNLHDRRVVVTGGSRGLGRAIVQAFVDEKADVMSVARSTPPVAIPGVNSVCLDMADPEAATRLATAVQDWRGGVDVLVCNVGSGTSVPPGSETSQEWRRVLDVNLFTAIHAIEGLRDLISPQGVVICISSITGRRALGAPVAYSSAKAALDGLVVNLARPLADRGIRIVGIAPGNLLFEGSVWARKLTENSQAVHQMLEREVPLKRLGDPREVADLALFLASERASFITGTVIVADGGQVGAP
jgi:3-oxoacyl-[acyl-carrier protein] reductase